MGNTKILDFESFSNGFELLVDVDKSEPVACIVLAYPNGTTATIRGDKNVVKQIVARLDGQVIEYEQPQPSQHISKGDSNE